MLLLSLSFSLFLSFSLSLFLYFFLSFPLSLLLFLFLSFPLSLLLFLSYSFSLTLYSLLFALCSLLFTLYSLFFLFSLFSFLFSLFSFSSSFSFTFMCLFRYVHGVYVCVCLRPCLCLRLCICLCLSPCPGVHDNVFVVHKQDPGPTACGLQAPLRGPRAHTPNTTPQAAWGGPQHRPFTGGGEGSWALGPGRFQVSHHTILSGVGVGTEGPGKFRGVGTQTTDHVHISLCLGV